jgi:hypothetical protein
MRARIAAPLALLALALACADAETPVPATPSSEVVPEVLVRRMSDFLASAQSFRFSTWESHERLRTSGEMAREEFTRRVAVHRPDRLWFEIESPTRHGELWFDRGALAAVGYEKRVFARAQVPVTIDEATDFAAERLDLRMPMGDILASDPYASFIGPETQGTYVGFENLDGESCHHLAFDEEAVAFELWIREHDEPLPCKLSITYKLDPGAPRSELVFKDWELGATIPDAEFAFVPPKDFREIRFVEAFPVREDDVEEEAEAEAEAGAQVEVETP